MSSMSAFTARRARHLLRGAAILSATVLACSLVVPDAQASTGACTSEPIWHLSNGVTIDTTTNISADPKDVQSVNYSMKLPPGVTCCTLPVVDNGKVLGPVDHYSYTSGPAGSYSVGVQVSTGPRVSVSATTTMVGGSTAKADGHSGQQLWMQVS